MGIPKDVGSLIAIYSRTIWRLVWGGPSVQKPMCHRQNPEWGSAEQASTSEAGNLNVGCGPRPDSELRVWPEGLQPYGVTVIGVRRADSAISFFWNLSGDGRDADTLS